MKYSRAEKLSYQRAFYSYLDLAYEKIFNEEDFKSSEFKVNSIQISFFNFLDLPYLIAHNIFEALQCEKERTCHKKLFIEGLFILFNSFEIDNLFNACFYLYIFLKQSNETLVSLEFVLTIINNLILKIFIKAQIYDIDFLLLMVIEIKNFAKLTFNNENYFDYKTFIRHLNKNLDFLKFILFLFYCCSPVDSHVLEVILKFYDQNKLNINKYPFTIIPPKIEKIEIQRNHKQQKFNFLNFCFDLISSRINASEDEIDFLNDIDEFYDTSEFSQRNKLDKYNINSLKNNNNIGTINKKNQKNSDENYKLNKTCDHISFNKELKEIRISNDKKSFHYLENNTSKSYDLEMSTNFPNLNQLINNDDSINKKSYNSYGENTLQLDSGINQNINIFISNNINLNIDPENLNDFKMKNLYHKQGVIKNKRFSKFFISKHENEQVSKDFEFCPPSTSKMININSPSKEINIDPNNNFVDVEIYELKDKKNFDVCNNPLEKGSISNDNLKKEKGFIQDKENKYKNLIEIFTAIINKAKSSTYSDFNNNQSFTLLYDNFEGPYDDIKDFINRKVHRSIANYKKCIIELIQNNIVIYEGFNNKKYFNEVIEIGKNLICLSIVLKKLKIQLLENFIINNYQYYSLVLQETEQKFHLIVFYEFEEVQRFLSYLKKNNILYCILDNYMLINLIFFNKIFEIRNYSSSGGRKGEVRIYNKSLLNNKKILIEIYESKYFCYFNSFFKNNPYQIDGVQEDFDYFYLFFDEKNSTKDFSEISNYDILDMTHQKREMLICNCQNKSFNNNLFNLNKLDADCKKKISQDDFQNIFRNFKKINWEL